jgi:tetratricopeptide (TPR) repeat protein
LYRSALHLDRRLFGEEHPYVATVMNNLATLLALQGRNEEAERLFRESLAMFERVYGADHWRVGTVQGGLAGVLSARGDGDAEGLFKAAVAHLERVLSPQHPSLEPVLLGYGRHLIARGDARAAEPVIRRVLKTRTARLGERDPRTAEAQVRLGVCLARLGAPEALALLTAGYERLRNEPRFAAEASDASRLLTKTAASDRFVPILRR